MFQQGTTQKLGTPSKHSGNTETPQRKKKKKRQKWQLVTNETKPAQTFWGLMRSNSVQFSDLHILPFKIYSIIQLLLATKDPKSVPDISWNIN